MANPQPGLFIQETHHHYHLQLTLRPNVPAHELIKAVSLARTMTTWLGAPNVVWGFGPTLWSTLLPGGLPANVRPFEAIQGVAGVSAPATPYDIWFWCHGSSHEAIWRTAFDVRRALEPVATIALAQQCYTAHDSRDPSGFIDGTENPLLDEALQVALVPAGQPGEAGSPVLVQKWVHNMPAFEALPQIEQEGVIGRTREDSIELGESIMPPTSHVSRNTIVDPQGRERHIFRRNTPFASVTEVGTMFIGCAADTDALLTMLARMFGTSGDGLTDHLTQFSMPITGSYYFVPSMDALTEVFGGLVAIDDLGSEPEPEAPVATSTSLNIGSLQTPIAE